MLMQKHSRSSVIEPEESMKNSGLPQENYEDELGQAERKGCCAGLRGKSKRWWRNVAGFWLMGLLNNTIYVVMNAGAKQINSGGVGLVYAVNVAPSLLVKGTLPYWYHKVSYDTRVLLVALLNVLSLMLVGLTSSLGTQLLGVAFGATASALGEASFLGYSSYFKGRSALTAWSSGTGFAGIFGYAWNVLWMTATGNQFSKVCLTGLVLPTCWLAVYYKLMTPPKDIIAQVTLESVESGETADASEITEEERFTVGQKFKFIVTRLWPYMIPLFLVYFAEYAMQSGAWAAIGFPIYSTAARQDFYWYSNWLYQAGVFLSRSSGSIVKLNKLQLWIMPVLQTCFLVFFVANSMTHFWWDNSILVIAFITGLLGGAVYVHAFLLISTEIEPKRVEFSLTAASLADTFGILLSDVSGIFIQGCLYAHNNIVDCTGTTCSAPTYTCGHTFNTTFNANYL